MPENDFIHCDEASQFCVIDDSGFFGNLSEVSKICEKTLLPNLINVEVRFVGINVFPTLPLNSNHIKNHKIPYSTIHKRQTYS